MMPSQPTPDTVMAQITVTMFGDGRIETSGSIQSKVLAYGLLEVAKDTVKEHSDKAAQRVVEPTDTERRAILTNPR